jgi:hypothetical protein
VAVELVGGPRRRPVGGEERRQRVEQDLALVVGQLQQAAQGLPDQP